MQGQGPGTIGMSPNNGHISRDHGTIGPSILPGQGQQTGSGPLQRNLDLNVAHQGNGIDVSEDNGPQLSLDLFRTGRSSVDIQIPASGGSSSPVMIHSGSAGYVVEENINREGLPTDGRRRLLCKRRAPEVLQLQNNVTNSLNAASSFNNGAHSATPAAAPPTQVGEIDNFQRNTRLRTTVSQQNPGPVNLSAWNSSNCNLQQATGRQRPVFSPFGPFPITGSPQVPVLVNPPMLQQPIVGPLQAPLPSQYWNGANMLPFGSSSLMIPSGNMQANLNLVNGNASFPPFSSMRYPQPNMAEQYAQRLQYFVDRSEAWRMGNYCPIHYGATPTVRDMDVPVRGGNPRPAQVPLRSGAIAERQAGHQSRVSRTVLSQIAAQRRRRLVSQIRNYLRLVRRAGDLRIEDAIVMGPSFLHAMYELEDIHDDMRLDVDNMSYEELLDLEEQIGNVNTGLSEEAIRANLRRRKYQPITVEHPAEAEPCCICQENYVNGEELGKLDCGHDFHFNCIKLWLVQKNSCPVCKKTALAI